MVRQRGRRYGSREVLRQPGRCCYGGGGAVTELEEEKKGRRKQQESKVRERERETCS